METKTPNLQELTERAKKIALSVEAWYLPLAQDAEIPLESLKERIRYIDAENQNLASLKACGFPQFSELEYLLKKADQPAIEQDDYYDEDELEADVYNTFLISGGFLVSGIIPRTKRVGEHSVMTSYGVTTHQLFWGETFEAALERAVTWAEPLYGNNWDVF